MTKFISSSVNSLQDFKDYLKARNVPFSFAAEGKRGYFAKINMGDADIKYFTQTQLSCFEGFLVGRGYEIVLLSYVDCNNPAIINS